MSQDKKINKQDVENILPLTPLQQGMLFHYLKENKSVVYFEQLSLHLAGNVNIDLFREAWKVVAIQNEVLRTVFRWDHLAEPVQIVLKSKEPNIKVYDFFELSEADAMKQINEFKEEDKRQGINLEEELWRVNIFHINSSHCIMLITNHHIIYDGWSNGIILKELFATYNNLCTGNAINYKQKTKYVNYIKLLKSKDKEQGKKFWSQYLESFQEKTILPEKKHDEPGYEGKKYCYDIGMELTQKINQFVNENEVTVASYFYAMWGIFLQKYNRINNIVFGITLSGRAPQLSGIEEMVGLFINTVPLRVTVNDDDTVIDVIRQIRYNYNQIIEYDYMPIVEIKSASGISTSETLFDSIMVVETYPLDKGLKNNDNYLSIEKYDMEETSNFDLTFVVETFGNIKFNFNYNSKVFSVNSLDRIMNYLVTLCANMLDNSIAKVKDLKVLSKEREYELQKGIELIYCIYDKEKTVNQLFEEQVEKNPYKVAIEFHNESITYGELNCKANKLARILRRKGVGVEKIVGLLVRRSINMFVLIIAILKAGATYLPIDLEYPPERKNYLLKDSDSCLLLTQKDFIDDIDFEKEILDIDTVDYDSESGDNLERFNNAYNAAYVIYTSGSTGKPKGTVVEHHSVHNLAVAMSDRINLHQYQSILCVTTIAFDMSIMETLVPIIIGLKIVLADEIQQKDPFALSKLIIDKNVEILETTPSRIKMLLIAHNAKINSCFEKIKLFLIGGESMDEQIVNSIFKHSQGILYNMYGPTETTVWSTAAKITNGKEINIGTPIANTYVYILDEEGNIVPPGFTGEICISGDGVARGYVGRKELTESKFVKNPFLENEQIYHTGDLGRITSDNSIEYIGRQDFQTKIRGFRVELGEIESRMREVDKIDAAVVIDKKNKDGVNSLYAYFEAKEKIDIKDLREQLATKLPDYMIPSYIAQIPQIPLTINLKVNRKSLPDISESIETGIAFEEPRNEVEKEVLKIWTSILEVKGMGINDDFYQLGGNSILLIKLFSSLNKKYSTGLTVQELFDNRTIKKQAEILGKKLQPQDESVKEQEEIHKITLGRR